MRRPDQPALTDAAHGRVSMPFLPTLAVVTVLGVASLYCPTSEPVRPGARAEAGATAAPGPTDFAPVAAVSAVGRPPAVIAFSELYPLDAAVTRTGSLPARPAVAARATSHVAAAGRRACPGRRCPEAPRGNPDPMAPARVEAAEQAEDALLPSQALPFAASVIQSLVPAAQAVGDAANLVRSGAKAVQGTVALAVADCLR